MSEPKVKANYYWIFRFLQILFLVVVSVISVVQLVVTIISLSQQACTFFNTYSSLGVILSASGGIPLAISLLSLFMTILGACAIKKMSRQLLLAYGILNLLIFILGFGTSVTCLSIAGDVNSIQDRLSGEFASHFKLVPDTVSDFFQINFKCCGLLNQTDWKGYQSLYTLVPQSCCIQQTCSSIMFSSEIWNDNCIKPMILFLQQNINLNAGILLTHSIIILIGSIVSIIFSNLLRNQKLIYRNMTNIIQNERTETTILRNPSASSTKSVPERQIVSTDCNATPKY